MKKRIAILFALGIILVSGSVVYASDSQENSVGIDVFAKYEQSGTMHPTVILKDGAGTVTIDADTELAVFGAPDNAVTLVAYKIPQSEKEPWKWFKNCLSSQGKMVQPYDIYFQDAAGKRINALDAEFTIEFVQTGKEQMVCSVTTEGVVSVLESVTENGKCSFNADGSHYYVFVEKSGKGTPGKPEKPPKLPKPPKPEKPPKKETLSEFQIIEMIM